MTIPVSMLLTRTNSSSLLVRVAMESKAVCTSPRDLGKIGCTFRLSHYKDWAIERTSPDPISLSANLCSSVLMIFEGREVRSSVAFLLT